MKTINACLHVEITWWEISRQSYESLHDTNAHAKEIAGVICKGQILKNQRTVMLCYITNLLHILLPLE
jgi:hypothetical protein